MLTIPVHKQSHALMQSSSFMELTRMQTTWTGWTAFHQLPERARLQLPQLLVSALELLPRLGHHVLRAAARLALLPPLRLQLRVRTGRPQSQYGQAMISRLRPALLPLRLKMRAHGKATSQA